MKYCSNYISLSGDYKTTECTGETELDGDELLKFNEANILYKLNSLVNYG